ncbi:MULTISPECIES: maleylacetate reductase [Actinoalloteichus]|uniref:Alcohol dehydrogenase, class IV n=1 Tax=Actinoalloteichus fjordicus TaxID=1612552 RepID=A0AAC9PSL2_9PSEU|nr:MULTISPECIES: maleylacetate reductase [Actinoalloteichus]APU14961.1 alcohol dehydrogenase, class IV [Actinoalloteichus fjordicus]APU21031.1 alcohol dehydrogenase, class IV [Actinoalloteichus sp. GBA129-24]
MRTFVHTSTPSRVIFGAGVVGRLGEEAARLGARRVLLVSGPSRRSTDRLRDALGPLLVAEFAGATMHAPVEITEQALAVVREHDVDCLVAIGGGTATGLAKAVAARTGLPQVIVPTTYAGSEVTSVLGETADGRKTTRSSPDLLPETVLYDVDLTLGLPVDLSITSAVNALAHAVEALYSPQANVLIDAVAHAAIGLIVPALPVVAEEPADGAARADLLEGAWLAGTCLAAAGMGLHHKLCHVLGGSFGLSHAPTHTVVLPHATAFNAPAVPEVMAGIAAAMGVPDAPSGLADLIGSLGGPTSLRELGMAEVDLREAARLAVATPYPNPRPVDAELLDALLRDAWHGRRPGAGGTARLPRR